MHIGSRLALLTIAAVCATIVACHSDTTTAPVSSGIFVSIDTTSKGDTAPVTDTINVSVHILRTSDSTSAGPQTVSWTVTGGGGSVLATSTLSDANGLATNRWVLGKTSGTQTLFVSANGTGATIFATGTALQIQALNKASADSQTVVTSATTPLVVRAADKFNNGVPGVVVTWTAPAGVLSAPTSTSGITGDATVNFTVPAKGTYSITASAPGFTPITFTVFGT